MDEIDEKLKKLSGKIVRVELCDYFSFFLHYSGTLEYIGSGVWKISSFGDFVHFSTKLVKNIEKDIIFLGLKGE